MCIFEHVLDFNPTKWGTEYAHTVLIVSTPSLTLMHAKSTVRTQPLIFPLSHTLIHTHTDIQGCAEVMRLQGHVLVLLGQP